MTRFWGAIPIALAVLLFALRACVHTAPLDRLAPGTAWEGDPPNARVYVGTVWVARGGPLIIGFQSTGPTRLTFASKDIRGTGVVKDRIVVEGGPQPIRFAAPEGARLTWSPVGRRGDMEYLPASSLSPLPPETAEFSHPGTARADGTIALALLVVLASSLLALARHRLARVCRETWIAFAGVLALALLARWLGLGAQGQTWDEDVNWASGRNYVTNLLSLDFSGFSWSWNYEHPPVMKLLDGIGAQFTDGFQAARALSAVWCALGCALLVPIGARLFRLRVGLLAGLVAALLPTLIAHGQVVGHESPTVLWWSLGVLLALGVHDDQPTTRALVARMVAAGAVVGIAIASRFVNGLLGPLVVLIILVTAPAEDRRRTAKWVAITALAAVVVFFAVWPRMWAHPIAHLQESLAKLKGLHAQEPFLGTTTNLPGPHYFLVYLYATAPVVVLAAIAGGLARVAKQRTRSLWLVLAWLAIPLAVAFSPVRQDGVRYVMPCLLALALLAALGVEWLVTRVERTWRHAFAAAAAALALYLAVVDVRTAPYYLDYFGEQVGGAGTVAKNRWFETAWWGEGVARAVAYVNEHATPGARVYRGCIDPVHLAWFREDLWTPARAPGDAAWIVAYAPATRGCTVPADAREVFRVTADGAVLALVYQRP